MSKIYIDAGAFDGDTVKYFLNNIENAEEYAIHAFEANPALKAHFDSLNGTFHEEAVWVEDGFLDFFIGGDPTGSTLVDTKESGQVDYDKPVQVKSIDFSQWILDTFDPNDYIILKMDIEGAEFEVLEKMITDGSIGYLSELWCEFHPNKVRKYKTTDKVKLIQKIKQYDLLFKEWH